MSKIVIALGGNALGITPSQQKKAVKLTAQSIVDLFIEGHKIIIVHGNGPQIGAIHNGMVEGYNQKILQELYPFPECGAMSQGYIGYHIQNAINNELSKRNIKGNVCTIVTQVLVDQNDIAFAKPTKPIGAFMSKLEAQAKMQNNKWVIKEDAGRGYRRVIASPQPLAIIEQNIILDLIKTHKIVIAGGGGGIPVYKENKNLIGIDAVIDKDATAAKIAIDLKADMLLILTAIDTIKINYGKENQKSLKIVSTQELASYIKANQFAPGSMLPKVEACINFTKTTNKISKIGSLKNVQKIIKGTSGTVITQN